MKIFIICCLLFIHVNMCIFIRGFRVSIRVSGIRRFGFGDGFPHESVSGSGSGFDFGFRFWVHGDSTRSEPDPLTSLGCWQHPGTSRCGTFCRPGPRQPRLHCQTWSRHAVQELIFHQKTRARCCRATLELTSVDTIIPMLMFVVGLQFELAQIMEPHVHTSIPNNLLASLNISMSASSGSSRCCSDSRQRENDQGSGHPLIQPNSVQPSASTSLRRGWTHKGIHAQHH